MSRYIPKKNVDPLMREKMSKLQKLGQIKIAKNAKEQAAAIKRAEQQPRVKPTFMDVAMKHPLITFGFSSVAAYYVTTYPEKIVKFVDIAKGLLYS